MARWQAHAVPYLPQDTEQALGPPRPQRSQPFHDQTPLQIQGKLGAHSPEKRSHTKLDTPFQGVQRLPEYPLPQPQTQHPGRAEGLHSELKRPARSQIPGSRILIFQASGGEVSRRVWPPPGPTPIPAAGLPAAPAARPPAAGSQRGAPRPGLYCRALSLSLSPRPQGVAPWPFAAACTLPPAGSP